MAEFIAQASTTDGIRLTKIERTSTIKRGDISMEDVVEKIEEELNAIDAEHDADQAAQGKDTAKKEAEDKKNKEEDAKKDTLDVATTSEKTDTDKELKAAKKQLDNIAQSTQRRIQERDLSQWKPEEIVTSLRMLEWSVGEDAYGETDSQKELFNDAYEASRPLLVALRKRFSDVASFETFVTSKKLRFAEDFVKAEKQQELATKDAQEVAEGKPLDETQVVDAAEEIIADNQKTDEQKTVESAEKILEENKTQTPEQAETERLIALKVKSDEEEKIREVRREILENPEKYNETPEGRANRAALAEQLLGLEMTDAQKDAVIRAHEVGLEDGGSIGNYTARQIAEKGRILAGKDKKATQTEEGENIVKKEAELENGSEPVIPAEEEKEREEKVAKELFDAKQRRLLIEAGIAGATLKEIKDELRDQAAGIHKTEVLDELQDIQDVLDTTANPNDLLRHVSTLRKMKRTAPAEEGSIDKMIDSIKEYLNSNRQERPERSTRQGREATEEVGVPPGFEGLDTRQRQFFKEMAEEQYRKLHGSFDTEGNPLPLPPESQEEINDMIQKNAEVAVGRRDGKTGQRIIPQEGRDPYKLPSSIQEICEMIADTEDKELWGENGLYALVGGYEGEGAERKFNKNKFNEGNFRRWVRSRMMRYIDDDADKPIQLFSSVGVESGFRQYNIMQMILNPGAFFYDSEAKRTLRDLAESVKLEIWLRGVAHNNDTQYRAVAGKEGDVPKALDALLTTNDFTKRGTLNLILGLDSGQDPMKLQAAKEQLEKAKQGKNNDEIKKAEKALQKAEEGSTLGKAIRAGILTYYYLSDPKMLEKIYGEGSDSDKFALFNNDEFRRLYKDAISGQKISRRRAEEQKATITKKGEAPKEVHELDPKEKLKYEQEAEDEARELTADSDKLFFKNGVISNPDEKANYVSNHLNIFNTPGKNNDHLKESRQKITVSLMQRFGLDYDEAQYAEWFAYAMSNFTGSAARNDYQAVGFDAWTKALKLKDYRSRQTAGRRLAVYGNKFDLFAFKSLGYDFYSGIKTQDGRTMLEAIQGGQGDSVNLDNDTGNLLFTQNEQRQFYANVLSYNFKMLSYLGEGDEANFDQFIKYDVWGRMEIDGKKANEVLDGLFKSFRYPLATYPNTDFSKRIETEEMSYTEKGAPDKLVYKVTSVAESMFGREVLDHPQYYLYHDKDFGVKDIPASMSSRDLEQKELDAKIYFLRKVPGVNVDSLIKEKDGVKDYSAVNTEFGKYAHIDIRSEGKGFKEKKMMISLFTPENEKDATVKNNARALMKRHGVLSKENGKARIDAYRIQADKQEFWKWPALTEVAAQLLKHREYSGTGRRYTGEDVERIYAYLQGLPDFFVQGEEGNMSDIKAAGRGLTREQMDWLRRVSKTQTSRMLFEEGGIALTAGGFGSFMKVFGMLFKEVTSGK